MNKPEPKTNEYAPTPGHGNDQNGVDPYAGMGGSYLLDPATGERTLIERTQEPETKPEETDHGPE